MTRVFEARAPQPPSQPHQECSGFPLTKDTWENVSKHKIGRKKWQVYIFFYFLLPATKFSSPPSPCEFTTEKLSDYFIASLDLKDDNVVANNIFIKKKKLLYNSKCLTVLLCISYPVPWARSQNYLLLFWGFGMWSYFNVF